MREYLVLLGSNIDAKRNLPAALDLLQKEHGLEVLSSSGTYESPAVVATGEIDKSRPAYHNVAMLLRTDLESEVLRNRLRQIEAALGRTRGDDKFADRTIDIDIVGTRGEGGDLNLDPAVKNEAYALLPAAEIVPSWHCETGGPSLKKLAEDRRRRETEIRRI